jgi:glycosyltransferase involved in cell wall biosynthesis
MPVPKSDSPRILLAHPWLGRGGSEAVALWSLQALQGIGRVSLITASTVDWDDLNRTYGTAVDPSRIELRHVRGLPLVHRGDRLVAWQRALFEGRCREAARDFDLCISAYNPIYFGKPGIQLIGDFSFSERARLLLYPNAEDRLCHRQSPMRRLYLSLEERLRGWSQPLLAERGDCAVANSFWTAERLERIFRLTAPPVLYPPCPAPVPADGGLPHCRDPLGFVSIGRISPEKEIETVIAILDRVRGLGYPATLDLAGQFGNDPYARRIRRLVADRADWIRTPGFLAPREKAELFASRTFGLHACRVEAFGIAVAEMAAAGLVPLVPSDGATREIAAAPELIYSGGSDAVRKIVDLIEAPDRIAGLREGLVRRAGQFQPEVFMRELIRLAGEFLGRPIPALDSIPAQSTGHVAARLSTAY